MQSVIVPGMDGNASAYKALKCIKILVPIVIFGFILTIVTFAITAATLAKINREFDRLQITEIPTTTANTNVPTTSANPAITTTTTNPIGTTATTTTTTTMTTTNSIGTTATTTTTTTTITTTNPIGTTTPTTTTNPITTTPPSFNDTLAANINITNVMGHLQELQIITNTRFGNRAVHTIGFNNTLDYIIDTLNNYTNYNVTTSFFPVRKSTLLSNPILVSSVNGTTRNHTYSTNPAASEFYQVQFSTSINTTDYVELSVIPNVGCTDTDWLAADPPPQGRVALVKRGNCTFVEKATFASKYNVTALLIYNNGTTSEYVPPIPTNLGQSNTVPALFLSYTLGQELADTAEDSATNVSVLITIDVNDETGPVGNICADTPTGDPTQTIVIGGHSDSVPAGPGINDNGSGSAAILELALAIARLFETSTYGNYTYRVRFCWWGAEELGLLGAAYHVAEAKNSAVVGERLSDYLINLNYDMLGSTNFMFGIYDGETAPDNTPVTALAGSNKITALFQSWFEQQNLPWNNTDFSGRSDYGPFLAEGIVAGGLFSGAEGLKSETERDYYEQLLGSGLGGIANSPYDPCYHQACDTIDNISEFGYDKMVQAAASILDYLARQDDLKTWLYPNGIANRARNQEQQPEYDSINEYFRLPYR